MIWYVSFADDEKWLGACFVEAPTPQTAIVMSWVRGSNPGGEAKMWELPHLPPWIFSKYGSRLLGRDDLIELDIELGGDGTLTTSIEDRQP